MATNGGPAGLGTPLARLRRATASAYRAAALWLRADGLPWLGRNAGRAYRAPRVRFGLLALAVAIVGLVAATGSPASPTRTSTAARPVHANATQQSAPHGQPTPPPTQPGAPAGTSKGKSQPPKVTPPSGSTSANPSASATPRHGPAGSLIDTGTDGVALTFDDGPDPINTPRILDLLKQYNVKATFCVVGFRARDHPELVARIAAEGHTLCNHSWQHLLSFDKRDDNYVRWDLQSTNDAIHAAAPGAQISWFRAPGGNFTPRLVKFAADLHMKPIYWRVDDECWKTDKYGTGVTMLNHIKWEVQTFTKPGGIILSHDNGKPHTITAYTTILPWLTAHYRLIALPPDGDLTAA